MHPLPLVRVCGLFATAIVLLGSVFWLTAHQTDMLIKSTLRVEQTYEVLMSLEQLGNDVKEVESSTRGYVLMGHDAYLEPFKLSRARVHQQLQRMNGLLRLQAAHEGLLPPLRRAIELRLTYSERLIRLRREQGYEAAYRLKRQGQGLALAQDIARRLEVLMNAERRLLNAWLTQEHASADRLWHLTLVSTSLALGLIVLALGLILHYLLKQQQAERRLQQAYEHTAGLAAFSQALNQHNDLTACLQALLDSYSAIFSASRFSILAWNADTGSLTLLAHNHPDLPCRNGEQIDLSEAPLMRYALETGQTVHQDQGRGAAGSSHPCEGALCVPMCLGDAVLGVINLSSFPTGRVSQQELHHLTQIAAQLASALRRSLLYEQVAETARRDQLTGCWNRRALFERLDDELRRCRRYEHDLSLLLLDIDFFKQINDCQGHLAGDETLRALGQLLQTSLRQTDLICRYGGEEFAVLLPETSPANALRVAEQLRERIASAGLTALQTLTVSIGVAAMESEDTSDSLLARADQALYAAKGAGRNCVRSLFVKEVS